MNKSQIRANIKQYRNSLSDTFIKECGLLVSNKTISLIQQYNCKNVAVYASFNNEVSTKNLIENLLIQNYQVYIPIVQASSKQLLFGLYQENYEFIVNKYGIKEPVITKNNVIDIKELDFICVPLIAFDNNKNRLGMGKGYYDYTLKDKVSLNLITCGLAYANQQVNELPIDPWDIPLDYIVTEKNIF